MAENKVRQILARYSGLEGDVDAGVRRHGRDEMTVLLLVGELAASREDLVAELDGIKGLDMVTRSSWALLYPAEEHSGVIELLSKIFPEAAIETRPESHSARSNLRAILSGFFGQRLAGIDIDWIVFDSKDMEREGESAPTKQSVVLTVPLRWVLAGVVGLAVVGLMFIFISQYSQPLLDHFVEPRTGMRFVLVDGNCGESSPGDESCIESFFMGILEVSEADFEWLAGNSQSRFFPKVNIDYQDVENFIMKLNRSSGICTYRLPTYEQWRHAADLEFLENVGSPCEYANIAERDCKISELLHGGSKKANRHGIYDLVGNVQEWIHAESGSAQVVGGSFQHNYEDSIERAPHPRGLGDDNTGFRLVCVHK